MNRPIPHELRTRTISAAVLASAVLFITWWDPISFDVMCALAAVVLWREWRSLTAMRGIKFAVLGAIYIVSAVVALGYLRHTNIAILLAVFALVWTGDIAAYVTGKLWGRHKIAPAISPGKSWEGLAGAVVASAAMGAALGHVAPIPHAILGAFFAVLGLGGDLFESALKRHAGVKDSGNLIPGHGGLFDRVDALLPCAIFAGIALYIRLHFR